MRKKISMLFTLVLIATLFTFTNNIFAATEYFFPVPGYSFGSCQLNCNCSGHKGNHNGADITAPRGSQIVAAHSGTVTIVSTCAHDYAKPNGCSCGCGGRGNCIRIDGNGVSTTYMHMKTFSVNGGHRIIAGQEIGTVGSTGWSTGPHLHFELRVNGATVNPPNYEFPTAAKTTFVKSFFAGSSSMGRQNGFYPGNVNYWATNILYPAGYMLYGPYYTQFPTGILAAKINIDQRFFLMLILMFGQHNINVDCSFFITPFNIRIQA